MKKTNLVFGSVISLCILSLAGCSGKPTAADLMRAHATEMQSQVDLNSQMAKDWETGTDLVATGTKRVKQGEQGVQTAEQDLKKWRAQVEQGHREVAEGQALIQQSEMRFRQAFPDMNLNAVK